jgi:hypothetical protein
MSYPIVAYSLWQSLNHINELPADPMDREFGEAEDQDAFIHRRFKNEVQHLEQDCQSAMWTLARRLS